MTAHATPACETCPAFNASQLKKMGVNTDDADYVIALAGNPNTGKSTVFNTLTGLRQHVGNWPGKTVTRAEGGFNFNNKTYKLVDLPGTYSLLSTSVDEEVARDFILFGQPSVTVAVVDATRIERNLNLVIQILEITDHVVVALNLLDEAKRHGIEVDERHLARTLGVPVIPMVARKGQGVPELLQAIENVVNGEYQLRPYRIRQNDPKLEQVLNKMTAIIEQQYPDLPNARWVALRLLDGDASIEEAIRENRLGVLTQANRSLSIDYIYPVEAIS